MGPDRVVPSVLLAEQDPELAAALPVFPPWLGGVAVALVFVSAFWMRAEPWS
jgi:hypothetical protein